MYVMNGQRMFRLSIIGQLRMVIMRTAIDRIDNTRVFPDIVDG
jgi:hypothetical protein